MATLAPSWTRTDSTPSAGDGTSAVALSVSSSNSGSPERTVSPSFFSQRDRIPSVIDSPTDGTLISTAIVSRGQESGVRSQEEGDIPSL